MGSNQAASTRTFFVSAVIIVSQPPITPASPRAFLWSATTRSSGSSDLVVADHKKALGLAGVMGGWDTMITAETKNVLVEAAWFDPMAVRRAARRHGLHTDASHRFERGADFNAAPVASALVSAILLAGGGYIEGDLVDVRVEAIEARTASRKPVTLHLPEVHRILGVTLDKDGIAAETVEAVLNGLGCGLAANL